MNVRPDQFNTQGGNAALRPAPVPRTFAPLNELLLHLIDTLSLPLDEQAARRKLRGFAEDAGFEFFAYLNLRGSESFAVSNYPQEGQDRYVQMNYRRCPLRSLGIRFCSRKRITGEPSCHELDHCGVDEGNACR